MSIQDNLPKSRITLRYPTEINGAKENVSLPLRLLFLGDLSSGSSTDRSKALDDRKIRNINKKNFNNVIKNLQMELKFQVANKIDPSNHNNIDVTLPISSIKSFDPDMVAKFVPKIKSLLLIKKLLLELQSFIDNKKEFKKILTTIFNNKENLSAIKEQLDKYQELKLPNNI